MAVSITADPLELAPSRPIVMQYMTGRALYEQVIQQGIAKARVSVWIATANLKELMIEAPPGTQARARRVRLGARTVQFAGGSWCRAARGVIRRHPEPPSS